MKKRYHKIACVCVMVMLLNCFSIAPIYAQKDDTLTLLQEKVQFVVPIDAFTLYAFINATGFNFENHSHYHPLRQALRDDLQDMGLSLINPTYFSDLNPDAMKDSDFVTFIHRIGSPPEFKTEPALKQGLGIVTDYRLHDLDMHVSAFYKEAHIETLYHKYLPLVDQENAHHISEAYENLLKIVNGFRVDLNAMRDVEVYVNYFGSYWRGYMHDGLAINQGIGKPVYIQIGPEPQGFNHKNLVHEFSHVLTSPVIRGDSPLVKDLVKHLTYTYGSPRTPGYTQWESVIDESFVRAMTAWAFDNGDETVDVEMRDGFLMTAFIYNRISDFELDPLLRIDEWILDVCKDYIDHLAFQDETGDMYHMGYLEGKRLIQNHLSEKAYEVNSIDEDLLNTLLIFDYNEKVFTLYALLNHTGFDLNNGMPFHPIRESIRKDLAASVIDFSKPDFFTTLGWDRDYYDYVLMVMSDAPEFKFKYVGEGYENLVGQIIPMAEQMAIDETLREFYVKANIAELFEKYRPQHENEIHRVKEDAHQGLAFVVNAFQLPLPEEAILVDMSRVFLMEAGRGEMSGVPDYSRGNAFVMAYGLNEDNKTQGSVFAHEVLHLYVDPIMEAHRQLAVDFALKHGFDTIYRGSYSMLDYVNETIIRALESAYKDELINHDTMTFPMSEAIYEHFFKYHNAASDDLEAFITRTLRYLTYDAYKEGFDDAINDMEKTELTMTVGEVFAKGTHGTIVFDEPPQIIDNRTYLPLSTIARVFGARVFWEQSTQMATLHFVDKQLKIHISTGTYWINGVRQSGQVPIKVIANRTFLPLYFFADDLGHHVSWDQKTNTITIK